MHRIQRVERFSYRIAFEEFSSKMHSKVLVAVIVLLQIVLISSSPLWSNHDANWSYEPQIVGYKDQLKQWGLYPRIFRYGTSLTTPKFNGPKRNTKESSTVKKSDWRGRNEEVAGVVRKVQPASLSEWDAQHQTKYERVFRKFKEQRLKRMEQEVAELLWKW
ncbi:hypothetical protein quinque_005883 [Culex quinquefasciatus]|uniref:uncharacterized protein LOC119767946 n=1 Tax=Culex quinquefasciatus TaxID=7176 RepID=UPI0018E3828C|nr:uncharacterized protein LOC119767946 [Culex quinquefasciatus]